MNDERYTAAEIAKMRLPGLPTTKANVMARAAKESWDYVETTGVGGVRRLYRLPGKYTGQPVTAGASETGVLAAIAAGGKADPKMLAAAIQALEEWATENSVRVDPERKGALVAVLYDYLLKGASTQDIESLLTVVQR